MKNNFNSTPKLNPTIKTDKIWGFDSGDCTD
jgi:hypothetical protein